MRGNPPNIMTAIKRNTKTRTAHAETRRTPPSQYRSVKFNLCGYNFTKHQGHTLLHVTTGNKEEARHLARGV